LEGSGMLEVFPTVVEVDAEQAHHLPALKPMQKVTRLVTCSLGRQA
jgi:hypothetical protein